MSHSQNVSNPPGVSVNQAKIQPQAPERIHHHWVYLHGDYIPAEQASIAVTTQAFNYGTAVFEGIRGYLNPRTNILSVFRLDDHLRRLKQSADLLLIDSLPSVEKLTRVVLELLHRNEAAQDCYLRPVAYKQSLLPGAGFGVKLTGVSSGLSVNSLNMPSAAAEKESRCTISRWQRIPDNVIPARAKITGSYVNSALAMESARRGGFDDALMLNIQGNLAEATTSNVFLVRQGKLVTPPVSAHILEGITRDSVIQLADYMGFTVEQRDIAPSEIFAAEECFLTGTGVEIKPVTQIDHCFLNSGKENSITRQVQSAYLKAVRGELPAFSHWLTPVYTPAGG
ncbi:branched-chain amino acid transaminase [Vibrio quintilis]|uniref:Branched-chain-amino-acid aminotransferase n=1 Tax=Vibrio quintilis TaxID=1117707 RepID=A0A1M7Z137_9VIBR|nr:branched-chain amino acid transaminase [Vibrio quintilis]SHO58669.1 Branched-chain-amino-acid aminotransferase [Vibrio quintilis]